MKDEDEKIDLPFFFSFLGYPLFPLSFLLVDLVQFSTLINCLLKFNECDVPNKKPSFADEIF